MVPNLSPLTQNLVEKFFAPGDQAEAAQLLIDTCGNNLPFCQDSDAVKLERIRFAAIRTSIGSLDELKKTIQHAQKDWRDTLTWAGFGERLEAHRDWAEQTLNGSDRPVIILLMGLTGSGKTTVGSLLARNLGWMYYETDNFLSTEDFNRWVRGDPLPDAVVEAWLVKIETLIGSYLAKRQNAVFTCSALKAAYRRRLQVSAEVHLVYLHGSHALLEERQKQRKFQSSNLERLAYQSSIFEEPQDALAIDMRQSPVQIAGLILEDLRKESQDGVSSVR